MSTSDSASGSSRLTMKGSEDPRILPPIAVQDVWQGYFAEKLTLPAPDLSGRINAYYTPPKSPSDALFIFHHGAGSSAMSFAALASALEVLNSNYGILAFDARFHGDTVSVADEALLDFSLQKLCADFTSSVQFVLSDRFYGASSPDLVLVGHSMGGAVVAHTAQLLPNVIGLIVIDVVEGSAIDAVHSTQQSLHSRPESFPSLTAAVSWHLTSHTFKDAAVARISVPSLLRFKSGTWLWKTDLLATQPYWNDWFTNLSETFLAARCSKLLILAGTDRLDKELMIGHMQGIYQLSVIPEAGHFVHEDESQKVAVLLHDFVTRFQKAHIMIRQARARFRGPS